MITVASYGIHTDEVGLRYLVQDTGVTNALGFKKNPKFNIRGPKYKYACPHHHTIEDHGCPSDDEIIQFLSPIPAQGPKAYVWEGDPSDLIPYARYSKASCLAGWMLNNNINEKITLASNIQLTFIMGALPKDAEYIEALQNSMDFSFGKVVFAGDFYYSGEFPRMTLPKITADPEKVGLSNMYKYLTERD